MFEALDSKMYYILNIYTLLLHFIIVIRSIKAIIQRIKMMYTLLTMPLHVSFLHLRVVILIVMVHSVSMVVSGGSMYLF